MTRSVTHSNALRYVAVRIASRAVTTFNIALYIGAGKCHNVTRNLDIYLPLADPIWNASKLTKHHEQTASPQPAGTASPATSPSLPPLAPQKPAALSTTTQQVYPTRPQLSDPATGYNAANYSPDPPTPAQPTERTDAFRKSADSIRGTCRRRRGILLGAALWARVLRRRGPRRTALGVSPVSIPVVQQV